MTINLRYIDSVEELNARWSEIWALEDALDRFHADLLKLELRSGGKDWLHARIQSGLERGDYWLLVIEQAGEIVGIGTASIEPTGKTHPGPVGATTDQYLKESVRGQGLSSRSYKMRLETLRQRGVTVFESATYASNARPMEIWGDQAWGCTLRRPLRSTAPTSSMPVRRVKDLDQDWAGVWPLLRPSTDLSEDDARKQVERTLAKRGAMFIAGQGPAGVILGKVSVNPDIFVERVGVVTSLQVKDSGDNEISDALLGRMEQWMASKQVSDIETDPIRRGEYQAWSDRGFEPYLFWFRERTVGGSQPTANSGPPESPDGSGTTSPNREG